MSLGSLKTKLKLLKLQTQKARLDAMANAEELARKINLNPKNLNQKMKEALVVYDKDYYALEKKCLELEEQIENFKESPDDEIEKTVSSTLSERRVIGYDSTAWELFVYCQSVLSEKNEQLEELRKQIKRVPEDLEESDPLSESNSKPEDTNVLRASDPAILAMESLREQHKQPKTFKVRGENPEGYALSTSFWQEVEETTMIIRGELSSVLFQLRLIDVGALSQEKALLRVYIKLAEDISQDCFMMHEFAKRTVRSLGGQLPWRS
jgi:hypothetical protein